jgi:hypothetical protein
MLMLLHFLMSILFKVWKNRLAAAILSFISYSVSFWDVVIEPRYFSVSAFQSFVH